MNVVSDNLRWGIHEISEKWEGMKHPTREHLHVAVTHAPHEIKEEDVAIDQYYGPKPHQGGS